MVTRAPPTRYTLLRSARWSSAASPTTSIGQRRRFARLVCPISLRHVSTRECNRSLRLKRATGRSPRIEFTDVLTKRPDGGGDHQPQSGGRYHGGPFVYQFLAGRLDRTERSGILHVLCRRRGRGGGGKSGAVVRAGGNAV